MGGTGHYLYLLLSEVDALTLKEGETIFLRGTMSRVESMLDVRDTGRPSFPAGIIVEHKMVR
jgi:hypothetical protein